MDTIYFSGGSKSGNYLILAISRRQNKLIDGFLYLKIKNSDCGILETLRLPGTDLLQKEDEDGFTAEGIKIRCIEPMKKWKITFDEQLKVHDFPQKVYNVLLNLEFISDFPYFNYETDIDLYTVASAFALEKWSKSYFEILKGFVSNINYLNICMWFDSKTLCT